MHTTIRIYQIIVFILCIFLISKESVQAKLVTIQISGHITSATGNGLPGAITVGSVFTGTYSYDSLTPDVDTAPNRGRYQQSDSYYINISLGGYKFRTTNGFSMRIWNDFTDSLGNSYDWYRVEGNVSALPDIPYCSTGWSLTDYTKQAISSHALPNTAPNLTDWAFNNLQLMSGNAFLINGLVTKAVLIPEPATLFLLGLGGLLIRRK